MEVERVQENLNRSVSSIAMPDYGPSIDEFNPSWMESGGINGNSNAGADSTSYPEDTAWSKGALGNDSIAKIRITPYGSQTASGWDTSPWSRSNEAPGNVISPPCNPGAPPDSGTWIFGAIDGECQWIDTTTCS